MSGTTFDQHSWYHERPVVSSLALVVEVMLPVSPSLVLDLGQATNRLFALDNLEDSILGRHQTVPFIASDLLNSGRPGFLFSYEPEIERVCQVILNRV